MPTAPTPIDPLGTPPSTTDPTNFDTRADALFVALPAFVTQTNAVALNVKGNADEAVARAADAAGSAAAAATTLLACIANATAAATSAGAASWVSGTSYSIGDARWSPADGRVYRRRTAGAGTTDPSADATNWALVAAGGLQMVIVSGSSATIAANTDVCFTSASVISATLGALAVGDSFSMRCDNGRLDNTLDIGARAILGPNGQTRSGVITLNTLPQISLRWWGDYLRSN